jgi:hypothetical protein
MRRIMKPEPGLCLIQVPEAKIRLEAAMKLTRGTILEIEFPLAFRTE